ncbi:unnamed protein product [Peniophora sp. CBMAI 1063]|nr:unnamed protein product [Peniophora sp. CBMAI 1063]
MPQTATSARYSSAPGTGIRIRAYIDIADFNLSTPGPSPDFISDSNARLNDCFRCLRLPTFWLTSMSRTGYIRNETSPYHEAFYDIDAEAGQVKKLMEILSQIDTLKLKEAHLVALVLYQVKPDMAQTRPCANSDLPLAIAVNRKACTKYGLLALNHFANNAQHSNAIRVDNKILPAPQPLSPPTPSRKRYPRTDLVNKTPLVRDGAAAAGKASKTA